jgi:hypothetical protein
LTAMNEAKRSITAKIILVFIFFVPISLFHLHTTIPDKSSQNATHFLFLVFRNVHFNEKCKVQNITLCTLPACRQAGTLHLTCDPKWGPNLLMSFSSKNNIPENSLRNILDYIWWMVCSSNSVLQLKYRG